MERRPLFFTMVMHPTRGWIRVGNAHQSRQAAVDWLPLVRMAWHGMRAKVSQFTVRIESGNICEHSRRMLDEKYNVAIKSGTLSAPE